MSLSPFRRRGGFYDAHSEVNRLLDEMFGGLGRRPAGRMAQATAEWAPSVDVLPKDGDLVVRAEMPGVKPEDVEVAVHNGVLTISGERKVDQEEERAGYYVRELRHGSFRRSFWWSVSLQRAALRALAYLYVGYTLLATRRDLYLDAPGLPGRRGTLEGYLQDAVLVTGVDLLLIYTFGQDHAPLE